MACPYLEEVVMLFCRAYPVKKPIPRDRVATSSPCLGDGFERCPFFQERVPAAAPAVPPPAPAGARPEARGGARAVKTRKES